MKKLLFFAVALIGLTAISLPKADAQTIPPKGYFKAQNGLLGPLAVDTTAASTVKKQVLNATGYWDDLIIQAGLIKISGTPTGSAKLYGGIDGVNFPYQIAKTAGDTLAVTNKASQYYVWDVGASNFPYYQVVYTPTGTTQSVKVQTYFVTRKRTPTY
jgi:hypothetical protein